MKKVIFLLTIIIGAYLITPPIKAQSDAKETTPSSAISQEEVKEKIKQRLENVGDEKIDQVKGVIEKKIESKAHAYVGALKSLKDNLLTIETSRGEKKVKVATDSAIISVQPGKSKKDIELKEAEIGQFTIAMGFMIEDEIINAKRLIFSPIPDAVKRKVIWAKVLEIDINKLKVKNNGEETNFSIDAKTDLKIKGVNNPKAADIQIEDKVVAILKLDKDDKVISCKAIYVIPGKYSPEAEENAINATTSAESSPSGTIE